MGQFITIDTTRFEAALLPSDDSATWEDYTDAWSVCVPVTVGNHYVLSIETKSESVVGTWFRSAFSPTNTPTGQEVSGYQSIDPRMKSIIRYNASDNYLILQFSGIFSPTVYQYVTLFEFPPTAVVDGMGALIQRRRGMARESAKTINDYVQNGLVFWLDGIENTRNGHNASASKWEDLTSTHRDVTYNSSKGIGDKYCILNGKSTVSKLSSISTSYTIEVVADYPSDTSVQAILPWRGDNYGSVCIESRKIMFQCATSNYNGILMEYGINTYTARGKSNLRTNGRTAISATCKRGMATAADWMGYYSASYPFPLTTKIYAVRIYNRILTDAEVLSNALVDAARFN